VKGHGGLGRLAIAADLLLERERLGLARLDAAATDLRREAADLQASRGDPGDLLAMRGEAAGLSHAWETLRERRLLEIAARQAELAAERAEARRKVALACGRVNAIGKLATWKDR
jgi:hypothetical protein